MRPSVRGKVGTVVLIPTPNLLIGSLIVKSFVTKSPASGIVALDVRELGKGTRLLDIRQGNLRISGRIAVD
jgi:hypothetical protein